MKKVILLLVLILLSGCAGKNTVDNEIKKIDKIDVKLTVPVGHDLALSEKAVNNFKNRIRR